MLKINLDSPDIMDAKEAARIWGHADNYVRLFIKQNPNKFPKGTIRKFGKQWVVTTEGMEAITGVEDPRKDDHTMTYTVYGGDKAEVIDGAELVFDCEPDDIDTAYSELATGLHLNDQDEDSQDLIDFQNAKDDDVKTLLNDMKRMGFISDSEVAE